MADTFLTDPSRRTFLGVAATVRALPKKPEKPPVVKVIHPAPAGSGKLATIKPK